MVDPRWCVLFNDNHNLLLTITVIALVLTITNTVAFSRCDKFSHATNIASSALNSGGLARVVAGGMLSRLFGGR